MNYEMLVLDLDGTLTNSEKKITAPTREAIIEIQKAGKKVVLASGRPTPGVLPLAKELHLEDYGNYILSFNGAKIINCSTGDSIYNKTLPASVIPTVFEIAKDYDVDLLTYSSEAIISAIAPNRYTELESRINSLPIMRVDNFAEYVNFPVNKLLIAGEPEVTEKLEIKLKEHFHTLLNIYRSESFFLEVMPQNIDKAHSLQKLLSSLSMSADKMICCGDGFNDLTMIEYAGLGVAMENAVPIIKESADYITKSNDEDGVLYVINKFMR
ncbi:MAG: Cof-type HAD-IIB family hydrolase [Lachnospiraceae bacterium]|nr:Cof-type HAD-IIB family hydrolase [Lachnospiraceae bacterium]